MEKFCTLWISLTFIFACSSSGQSAKDDTLFLHKDIRHGSEQSIFIDNNPASMYYERIADFRFTSIEKTIYDHSLERLKKNAIKLTKQKTSGISSKWISIQQYNNTFHAYHPCDFFVHYRVVITDTAFIDWTGEGPFALKISRIQKINNKHFRLRVTENDSAYFEVIIRIIDSQRGIAIFEKEFAGSEKIRYLMISAETIRCVPIIVNKCEHHKQQEQNFAAPDYDNLLK